jgi:acetoin utilization deacetylase AcuC-like enzyme
MKDGALRRSEFHSELDFIPVPNISIENEVKMEQSTHAMSDSSSTSSNNNKDEYSPRVTKVCEADILRVHEWDYIDHLRRQCCRAEIANGGGGGSSSSSSSLDPLSNAKSPSYQSMSNNMSKSSSSNNLSSEQVIDQARQMENNNNSSSSNNNGGGGGVNQDDRGMIAGFFDSDTRLSPGSWNAAQAAVDACLTAVDTVMKDFSRKSDDSSASSSVASPNNNNDTAADVSHRKAFVAARPPGHHGS